MNTDSPSNLLNIYLPQIPTSCTCVLAYKPSVGCPSPLYNWFVIHVHREEMCSTGRWKAGVRLRAHANTHTTSVHSFPDPSVVTNRQNLYLCFSFQGRTSSASQSRPGWAAGQWRLKFCGLFEATGYKQKLRVAYAVLQPECGRVLCHLNTAQRRGAPLLPS